MKGDKQLVVLPGIRKENNWTLKAQAAPTHKASTNKINPVWCLFLNETKRTNCPSSLRSLKSIYQAEFCVIILADKNILLGTLGS